ncbi:MAG: PUA domain-containing protein [Candidatus Helarchaeota archaeon]
MLRLRQNSANFSYLIEKVRSIARFLFHLTIDESDLLFTNDIEFMISKKTNRIRNILINDELICTIRPTDGLILLSIAGAEKLKKTIKSPRMRVIILNEVSEFIKQGRNVFAKHVIDADPEIRPYSEVLIVNKEDDLLAVGKAFLNKNEMLAFQNGIAVKVRHGNKNKVISDEVK